jgi:hypothetical protein
MSESWMPHRRSADPTRTGPPVVEQQAAANNLANIHTPGFVGTRVVRNEPGGAFGDVFVQGTEPHQSPTICLFQIRPCHRPLRNKRSVTFHRTRNWRKCQKPW